MQHVAKRSVTEAHPSRVFKTACDTWYWLLALVYFRCCFWGSGVGPGGVQREGRG